MAGKSKNQIKFVVSPKIDIGSTKKYCRFKKMGFKYVDYKDPDFLMRFLNISKYKLGFEKKQPRL